MQEVLIIADGTPLSAKRLQQLAVGRRVMALDGAYEVALAAGITPDFLLGDFDTITPRALAKAKQSQVQVVDAPDQNFTDLEKGIAYFDAGVKILVAAATGGRLDHTLHNIRLLTKCADRDVTLYTEQEQVFLLRDKKVTLALEVGREVAIMGAPEARVTSNGLRYDMQKIPLVYGGADSACNHVASAEVVLEIAGKGLVIYQDSVV